MLMRVVVVHAQRWLAGGVSAIDDQLNRFHKLGEGVRGEG
jgi:hypothetical protein